MLHFHKFSPIFLMLIFAAALMACSSVAATPKAQKPQVRFVTVTPQPSATPSTSVAQTSTQLPANPATGDISLRNVAPEIGLIFKHGAFKESLAADPIAMMGGGLCWLDIDNDGWLDLYVINSHALHEIPLWEAQGGLPRNALFHNNRNGTFEDISATIGADLALRGNGCTAADFNKDGWWDIYVTADGPNALLWNNGDGTFTEGAAAAGVAAPEWNSAAVVGDLNGDGWPDLFVAAYIDLERKIPNPSGAFPQDFYGLPDHLYLSNGSPTADGSITFREVTVEAGLQKEERGLGAIFSDIDQDGDLDLYIANDGHPNRLYINEPTQEAGGLGFRLVDMTASADVGDSGSGMGIAGGDYDGDGRVDLFITNWQTELNALYRNETAQQDAPLFQYSTYRIGISGLGNNKTAWGAAWVDLDQDTDLDLFIAHGKVPITDLKADAQLARLYRNRTWNNDGSAGRPGQFIEWTDQVGLKDMGPLMARGSAVADYDNDGDLDIAINTIGNPLVLLQNNGPHGNWLQIKANGFYPGMKVKAELADGRQLVREWYSGSSYLASEDPRLHLGLGQTDAVSRLEIDWPDGQTESWTDVAANQVWDLSMHEGQTMNSANCDTLNIAHRGARSLAPENTLAAAQKGLDTGADMWELDVGMTADGELILIHDDTLERTSNAAQVYPQRAPWRVHEFTFDEIRQLDFGSWFVEQDPFGQIAAGTVTQADLESYRGEPAPTLREALEFTRQHNWQVNIEIKDLSNTPGDTTVVEKVVALVEELGMAEQVLISSFNHSYLEQAKAINPNLATGALVWNPVIDTAAYLTRLDAQAYNPRDEIIEPEAIANLRQQGFEVNIYTVNDEVRMKTLVEAGASGIFTDFPQLLKPIIEACR